LLNNCTRSSVIQSLRARDENELSSFSKEYFVIFLAAKDKGRGDGCIIDDDSGFIFGLCLGGRDHFFGIFLHGRKMLEFGVGTIKQAAQRHADNRRRNRSIVGRGGNDYCPGQVVQ